ncbi:MAG: GNAT family N-acetyltransferase, partial [Chloroflexi bacterium]
MARSRQTARRRDLRCAGSRARAAAALGRQGSPGGLQARRVGVRPPAWSPGIVRALSRLERALPGHRPHGREVGEVRFDFDVRDPDLLRLLMGWKSAQYRRTGRFDRFANRSVVRIVEELMEGSSAGCAGVLSVLYAAERPIAVRFGLRSHRTLFGWFPAFDVAFAKYRPGSLLLWKVAEAAERNDVRRIDLGKGHEEYKRDFKNAEVALAEGWVERRTATALLRR